MKDHKRILEKLGIEALNPMQEEALATIANAAEVVLLSPTGSGKTLAFLLPIFECLKAEETRVQALILAPSRELAIQIEQVMRAMGTGFKTNVVYGGGRSASKDKTDLKHPPAVLIGTPGRVSDHLKRGNFSTEAIQTLVLDEFDKSLEIGFEKEMSAIVAALPSVKKKILTSATQKLEIPAFVGLQNPVYINYLDEGVAHLKIKKAISPDKDPLPTLLQLLRRLGGQRGVVFCGFRESIDRVSDYLRENGIEHGCFYGGMEQKDRELALIKFRNGTHQVLVATDLAARGLDVPEIHFIIHYELPPRVDEFIHRNGRTARMNSEGTAYILKWSKLSLPPFMEEFDPETVNLEDLPESKPPAGSAWKTLHVSGGRRDKISKGDIAGFFMKQGRLRSGDLGLIEIKQDDAFVAVKAGSVRSLLELVDNTKLKTKKVRVLEV